MKLSIASSLTKESQKLEQEIVRFLVENKVDFTLCEEDALPFPNPHCFIKAMDLFLNKEVDKTILVCRTGSTAFSVATQMGIAPTRILKQEGELNSNTPEKEIFCTGYNYKFDDVKEYLMAFLNLNH